MNSPSRRNACENAINKEPLNSAVVAKSKKIPKPKTPVTSYDYEAAISQPDIPTYSKIDNNVQNVSSSESSDELSVTTEKRNLYVCGKAGVTTRKRGIVVKSKIQAKKATKIHPSICNIAKIKKKSMPPSEIIRNVENYEYEINNSIITNCQASSNLHQNLMDSRDIPKISEVAKNDKNLVNEVGIFKENSDQINKGRSCIPQNKTSKIPRIKLPIKPNSFLSTYEDSRIYPNRKLSVKNELKYSVDIESSANNEEETLILNSSRETLNAVDYQKLKAKNTLPIVHENSNLWCHEKSSEIDADEEFEGDFPTPTRESPIITSAGDDPRFATLLKSLALKCECRSCNDHKYTSTVRTDQRTETESWNFPEIENARKWKSTSNRKFIDVSSEDLDSSDYNVINNYGKTNRKNYGSNLTSHTTKPSSIVNHARMKTCQTTSFSFFDVFFDIIFWPFVFLRAKQ